MHSNLDTKFFVTGSSIIGKSITQEFFTCTGVIPSIGRSILERTNSYVDGIVITGDDNVEISRLKVMLRKEFEIKDLGQLKYFL